MPQTIDDASLDFDEIIMKSDNNDKETKIKENIIRKSFDNVKTTLKDLDESIKSAHEIEKGFFKEELKLLLENQNLTFQLDKEKYRNQQLKKFASSGSFQHLIKQKKSSEPTVELKTYQERCSILSDVLKRRNYQLRRAKQEIESKQIQLNNLQKGMKIKDKKYKRLMMKYAELYNASNSVDENYMESLQNGIDQLQIQVKNQEKHNQNLMYENNRLKKALTSKSFYDQSVQVSEYDILKVSYNTTG
ncbi:hypothetical protein O3M35_011392 [Rhynocoris fuscipes]|uniref:Uncharacterized protein n=1 Tax=Rhynocoris fuscipes TaxID=488301 RepID=A0AAW1CWG3_9HEMI